MIHRLVLCMAAAGIITSIPVQAAIDGVELARSSAGMVLRWENIKGAPYWISGPAPLASPHRGWHVVELKGNQSVAIHVPARAMLRVIAEQDAPLEAPVFSVSDGSGLALEHKPIPGADGRTWLVKTDAAHSAVIHLHRASLSDAPQRVALFLGYMEEPADAVAYRHELPLDGARVNVRQADEALARTYVRMQADEEFSIAVHGPDRLVLEYRLDASQAPATATLTMNAMLGDQPARLIHQITAAETAMPLSINGKWHPASKLERVALDIPPGDHQLRLRSSHGVLLRAAVEGKPDFLLPEFNVPEAWRNAGSNTVLEELEQKSIAAGVSNRWRDIGALASQRLQREAFRLAGQSGLQNAADELHDALTQYHDLLPAEPNNVQARSVAMQLFQSSKGMPRHHVAGPDSAFAPTPLALFHHIGDTAIRFALPKVPYPIRLRALVPSDAAAVRIEVKYDNGSATTLTSGMPALSEDSLRPGTTTLATVQKDAWPPTLGGHADRAGAVAIQTQVSSMEWQIPPNVKSVTLRTVGDSVPVALQWAGSAEYFLDDQFLAQLAQHRTIGNSSESLMQAASQPLQRMLEAAYAQFTANVTPPAKIGSKADNAKARQAAQAAKHESEPARAVELWQQAMQTSDASQQAQALRGMTKALFQAGERFTAERLLRSHWISNNPTLARAAEEELDALYAREDDRDMQTLFAAARVAKDNSSYARLSKALVADGNDAMALLAGLVSQERDLPALLQSALRSRKWKTLDALVAQCDAPQERAFWEAQRALSLGQLDQAERKLIESGAENWSNALAEGRSISGKLHGNAPDRSAAVQSWLQWQAKHPGERLWQDRPDTLVRHGGGVSMRSIALNLRSAWWRASAQKPLVTRVVGPARIRVEARPLHESADSLSSGWLRVKTSDQLWLQPFYQNQPAPGLEFDTQKALPGMSVVREINLPAGLHELSIDAGAVPVVARLQVERPALQLPVLPAPVAVHFESHVNQIGRLQAAPTCGFDSGCQVVADGSLNAYRVTYEPVQWIGLPKPDSERDPIAGRLADNDIDGALKSATDPAERMRLLLWMAETRPSERARAMSLGAALAKEHPELEVQTQWNQLAESSSWTALSLVDRSAGLRRVEVLHGTPESPAARIRAAMLPPLREGEVRIGAGTRATLRSDAASPGSLIVELTADDMPGNVPLPLHVTIERNGSPLRTVQLKKTNETVKIQVSIPAGDQQISVVLPQAYSNQFLRVRFTGTHQPEPQVTRDWHIATSAQPVQASLSGPTWIRIDRLDKDGVRSEERLLTQPVSTLVLRPQPCTAESLYRIYQLRVNPKASTASLPRPSNYNPAPLSDAPTEWSAVSEPALQRVRFTDAEPLEGQRDSTLTARVAFQNRRNSEATGGSEDLPSERFVEAGISWRRRNEDQSQARFADMFVREREHGSPVLGFKLQAEQDVRWLAAFPRPFKLNASLSGFAQNTPDKLGASLSLNASVSQIQKLTSTLSHKPSMEFIARAMNLESVQDRSLVDTDVFSTYRKQHNRALILSDTLSWQPWRDTHVLASISATTNPNFSLMNVDNHQASIQWRQLVGPVIMDIGGRTTWYWADANRPTNVIRREVRFGTSGNWWLNTGKRIEVRAELRRDIGASTTWGGIELRWHWGPGRQLRDFSPSELDFSAIRNWQMPTPHNRIEEE